MIDEEALKKELSKAPVWTTLAVKEIVENTPSIDIVRCGECKYKDEIVNYCYENDRDVNADDFCSYGEREGE